MGAILAKQIKTEVVIVGGSAIEVYTSGAYVSGDVSLVGERGSIVSALERWGFCREGRRWSRSDLEQWVDPVGRYYTGDVRKLREVSTPYGMVRLASVEDLIAKRLIEVKVWPRAGTAMFDQAVALATEYDEDVDWDYVTRVTRRERADDLVAELRHRVARTRQPVRARLDTPRKASRARGGLTAGGDGRGFRGAAHGAVRKGGERAPPRPRRRGGRPRAPRTPGRPAGTRSTAASRPRGRPRT